MPSLVLQFYNNQRNQRDSDISQYDERCRISTDEAWYSPSRFEFYNFAASMLEVLSICYQMGYLVFIETITPIFEFKKVAKQYHQLDRKDIKPYDNYNWIIGDKNLEVNIQKQSDFKIVSQANNTPSIDDKIDSYILTINKDSEADSGSKTQSRKQQKAQDLGFKINSFFNPKYQSYILQMRGFHLDFSYVKLKQQKWRQIQFYLRKNLRINDLSLDLAGCGLSSFSVNFYLDPAIKLKNLKLSLLDNRLESLDLVGCLNYECLEHLELEIEYLNYLLK